ncbi:PepSY domain-containing protein [Gimibacter soli]|uniref:PepSY domain-containing protein n=1 Tax=Gimibacter soli TaxID=3024400 RepID=A0AAE9XSH6_9PROT|nr:PepSY domain-containing protein [Gimibacter soli]WCL55414.1 PepSY domain-containing protein [Gimibacter soli]
MMTFIRKFWLAFLTLALVAPLAPTAAEAQQRGSNRAQTEQDEALAAQKRGDVLPYHEIKKRTEAQIGGKVVGQRLRNTNTGWVYELRVMGGDGKVAFVLVDAASGKILKAR